MTLVDAKVSAVKKNVETELKTRVEPIQQQLFQTEADRHFSAIRAAHPDINAILDSGDLFTWIDSLPPVMQNGAKYVYQYGTAQEVISLLNDYKSARGVKPRTTMHLSQLHSITLCLKLRILLNKCSLLWQFVLARNLLILALSRKLSQKKRLLMT